MKRFSFAAALILSLTSACAQETSAPPAAADAPRTEFQKVTPILFTKDVAACVAFWKAFGLDAPVTVPLEDGSSDGGLSFAIISGDAIELMYQSFESAAAQNPSVVEGVNRAMIFVEVATLEPVLAAATAYEIVVPVHTTDYGAREIYVRDPAGNVIGFAQQGAVEAAQ